MLGLGAWLASTSAQLGLHYAAQNAGPVLDRAQVELAKLGMADDSRLGAGVAKARKAVGMAAMLMDEVNSHGPLTGVCRFVANESLRKLADKEVRARADKAEEAGWLVCFCAVMVVAFSLLEALVPALLKANQLRLAFGIHWAVVVLVALVAVPAAHVVLLKGRDRADVARILYFGIVALTSLASHALLFGKAHAMLRVATEQWLSWESNMAVLGIGVSLFAAAWWNRKVTDKWALLAKLAACVLMSPLSQSSSLTHNSELAFRAAHFGMAFYVERHGSVPDVVVWTGAWAVLHRMDGWITALMAFLFEGETDIAGATLLFVRYVTTLMEQKSFEELLVPPRAVMYAIVTLRACLFAVTALASVRGLWRWLAAGNGAGNSLNTAMYIAAVIIVVGLMAWALSRDWQTYRDMETCQFFFSCSRKDFELLKSRVQYEEVRGVLKQGSELAKPDPDMRLACFGRVSCGKSQLVRAMLSAFGSEDANNVTGISAVGGSTQVSREYLATKINKDSRLLLVDTPGFDPPNTEDTESHERLAADALATADLCLLVFKGDSDADLYERYREALQAVCRNSGFEKGTPEYRRAWERVILVRTHADEFTWVLDPAERIPDNLEAWPPSLLDLLESICKRINEEVLPPLEMEPGMEAKHISVVSTSKSERSGVDELCDSLTTLVQGELGQTLALEREARFLEKNVELLKVEVNTLAAEVNRSSVVRSVLNLVKKAVDPFFALGRRAWANSWVEHYRAREQVYQTKLSQLKEAQKRLDKVKANIVTLRGYSRAQEEE